MTLKALIGQEGIRNLRKLELSEDNKKEPEGNSGFGGGKFKPRHNVIFESYRFNSLEDDNRL